MTDITRAIFDKTTHDRPQEMVVERVASTVRSEYLGSILGDIAGKSYGETPEKYQTRCTSEMIDRQYAWKEGEIAKLLPRWLRWLLLRNRSRFIARLAGIQWQQKRDGKTGARTIELWQRGVLKSSSTWRYTYDQTH